MKKYIYHDNLESKRLLTRKLTLEDVQIWEEFFGDDEASDFLNIPGLDSDYDRSFYWITKQLNRYTKHQFGLQALIDKKTKQFVGQCGLLKQEIDGKSEIEVGYHILKKYRGHGYAPEAAKLFIDYAFDNKLSDSVISIIGMKNIKSQKVADKNGLTREKQSQWAEDEVFIYRLRNKLRHINRPSFLPLILVWP